MLEILRGGVSLREFQVSEDEFSSYVSWLRDLNTIATIGRTEYLLSMDTSVIREYVKQLNVSSKDSFFAVYYEDVFIGTYKVGHIDWRCGVADIGIMIGNPQYRGRGLSTQIIQMSLDYCFRTLGLRRLTGGCFSTNIAMCKSFERAEFKQEGVLRKHIYEQGTYCDHILYGLLKEEYIMS